MRSLWSMNWLSAFSNVVLPDPCRRTPARSAGSGAAISSSCPRAAVNEPLAIIPAMFKRRLGIFGLRCKDCEWPAEADDIDAASVR